MDTRANRFAGSTFRSTPCNARIAKKTKKQAKQDETACAPACSAYDESRRDTQPNSAGAIRLGRRFIAPITPAENSSTDVNRAVKTCRERTGSDASAR